MDHGESVVHGASRDGRQGAKGGVRVHSVSILLCICDLRSVIFILGGA